MILSMNCIHVYKRMAMKKINSKSIPAGGSKGCGAPPAPGTARGSRAKGERWPAYNDESKRGSKPAVRGSKGALRGSSVVPNVARGSNAAAAAMRGSMRRGSTAPAAGEWSGAGPTARSTVSGVVGWSIVVVPGRVVVPGIWSVSLSRSPLNFRCAIGKIKQY